MRPRIGGAARSAVARLNADGTIDSRFTPPAIVGYVSVVSRLSDGKILIGGNITTVDGVSRGLLVRLQSDGALDRTFTPNVSGVTVRAIYVQPDGRIIIGGNFNYVANQYRSHLARLHSDGPLDASYRADVTASTSQLSDGVFRILGQPDGTVYVAGFFTVIAGQLRQGLARFTPNGVVDSSYIPTSEQANITALCLQRDGKLVVGGSFSRLGGAPRENIARLLPSGLADPTFNPSINTSLLRTVIEQADGKLIVGGPFTLIANSYRSQVARLNVNGTIDPSFAPDASGALRAPVIDGVYSLQISSSGILYIGGGFTMIGAQALPGLARLQLPFPHFSVPPASVVTAIGGSATFAVAVTGDPTSYQWRKDGIELAGATSSSFTISSVKASDAGTYDVIATNAILPATSAPATLTIAAATVPPTISAAPANLTVLAGAPSTLTVTPAGTAPFTYQWLRNGTPITGATSATLTLDATLVSDAAAYSVKVTNSAGSITSYAATLTVTPISRISNLSVLTSLSSPTDSFTLGYVIGGNATTGAKPLLLRAAGPSLAVLGVAGTLDDPQLELFSGSAKTTENDNWGTTTSIATTLTAAFTAVGAFPFASPTSKDAATTANLTTRDNSVKISAANEGTGLVIAEIYDATPSADFSITSPRLLNVSVLKSLGTGLTVGFTIAGTTPKTVLIRAIGPTLGDFGVPGTVVDPQLVLFNASSVKVAENDNWSGTSALTAAFSSVGAFALPATSKDAALLTALPPGGYSVQVTGVNNTTGAALVEVYEVP